MNRFSSSGLILSIFWASPTEPSVHTPSTCVSPLVNRPVPCVRGNRPTSLDKGLISFRLRPSGRSPVSRTLCLKAASNASSKAVATIESSCSSPYFSKTAALISATLASLSSSSNASASARSETVSSQTATVRSSSYERGTYVIDGFPNSLASSSWSSIIWRLTSCARSMASRTMSSDTSLAPASIMITPEREPATIRSSWLCSSCSYEGLTTNSRSM